MSRRYDLNTLRQLLQDSEAESLRPNLNGTEDDDL